MKFDSEKASVWVCRFGALFGGLALMAGLFLNNRLADYLIKISPDGDVSTGVMQKALLLVLSVTVAVVMMCILFLLFNRLRRLFVNVWIVEPFLFCCESWRMLVAAWRRDSRFHKMALILILLVAAGIRLHYIGQPVRLDEGQTYSTYASSPLYVSLTDYKQPNTHVLHSVLCHLSLHLGPDLYAMRIPAFLAGMLVIVLTYLWGRRVYDRYAGLLAASFVAVSILFIEYSVTARGYTMLIAWTLLSYLTADLILEGRKGGWPVLGIWLALGFYTIPTMLYPAGGVCLWLLSEGVRRRKTIPFFKGAMLSVLTGATLTFMLYLPIIVFTGWKPLVMNKWIEPRTWPMFADEAKDLAVAVYYSFHSGHHFLVVGFMVAGFLFAVLFPGRLTRHRVSLFAPLALWSGFVVVVQRIAKYIRVWLFLYPLYVSAVAGAWSFAAKKMNAIIQVRQAGRLWELACVLFVVFGTTSVIATRIFYCSIEPEHYLDNPALVQWLKPRLKQHDNVLANVANENIRVYFTWDNLPQECLDWNVDYKGDVYLILKDQYAYTDRIIEILQPLYGEYSLPILKAEIGNTFVYQMKKKREVQIDRHDWSKALDDLKESVRARSQNTNFQMWRKR